MSEGSVFVRPAAMFGGSVFEHEEAAPFMMPLHKHDHMSEMYFVEKGEGEFGIDGRTYRAGPGTLLLYQRGMWHEELSTVHPFKGMYISFSGLQLRGLPPDFFLAPELPPVIQLGDQTASFARSFESCIAEFARDEPESRTIGNHLFGILLAGLARRVHFRNAVAVPPKPSQIAVQRARRHIEENYDKPITLHALSRLTYVNEYYLAHLFKEEMGVSPLQYLKEYRMDVAKRYLTTSEYPVREIAGLIGYQSETTFQHTFKRATGVTPGDYRKTHRGQK